MRPDLYAEEGDARPERDGMRFLSHSKMGKYLLCPEQYRLYYIERLRPRVPSANLVFGTTIHHALGRLFQAGADPVRVFAELWEPFRSVDLEYGARASWGSLLACGEKLLADFRETEFPKLSEVSGVETPFKLEITSLDVPFVGIVDLVARLDGRKTLVDFKTSASAYQPHEVVLSDQLSAYQLAHPDAEATALCVLVKTKEPRIEWHRASRSGPDLEEFLRKAGFVAQDIAAGRFYKRPGKHCSWCDFLPVCLGDKKRADETLISAS